MFKSISFEYRRGRIISEEIPEIIIEKEIEEANCLKKEYKGKSYR